MKTKLTTLMIITFAVIILVGQKLPAADSVIVHPAQGISFTQLNLIYLDSIEVTELYSPYCLSNVNVDSLFLNTGIYNGYLNMVTSHGWTIQNLSIDTSFTDKKTGIVFNMNDSGQVNFLIASILLTTYPLDTFNTAPLDTFEVDTTNVTLGGLQLEFIDSLLSVSDNLGMFNLRNVPNDENNLAGPHPNFEQHVNQCAPASVANSLQWLKEKFGLAVTHPNQRGLYDNTLVGKLEREMRRPVGQPTQTNFMIGGKLKYIDDNGLRNKLIIKHKIIPGYFPALNQDLRVGQTPSFANKQNISLLDWIIKEIKNNEDVELAMVFPRGGGHAVRVTGAGIKNNKYYLRFVHDADQKNPNKGLEERETQVVNNRLTGFYNAAPVMAISESFTENPIQGNINGMGNLFQNQNGRFVRFGTPPDCSNGTWSLTNDSNTNASIVNTEGDSAVTINSGTQEGDITLYYVVIDSCAEYYSELSIHIEDEPLPIELISFESVISNRRVTLNWTTASEENNFGFEIQSLNYSSDQWSKIGFIPGKGTVSTPMHYTFTDKDLNTGRYSYRLKQIDYNGNFRYYDLQQEVVIGIPQMYALYQNYPNPFNPVTIINYDLAKDGRVTLKIYDITGKEVRTLVNEIKSAGYWSVAFEANGLSSGMYFYRIESGEFKDTKKMMVIK